MASDKKTPSANQLKGSVKEAIGKLTGDARIEAEGMTFAVQESMQNGYPTELRGDLRRFEQYRARWLGNDPSSYATVYRMLAATEMQDERFARSTCTRAPTVPYGNVAPSGPATRASAKPGSGAKRRVSVSRLSIEFWDIFILVSNRDRAWSRAEFSGERSDPNHTHRAAPGLAHAGRPAVVHGRINGGMPPLVARENLPLRATRRAVDSGAPSVTTRISQCPTDSPQSRYCCGGAHFPPIGRRPSV